MAGSTCKYIYSYLDVYKKHPCMLHGTGRPDVKGRATPPPPPSPGAELRAAEP